MSFISLNSLSYEKESLFKMDFLEEESHFNPLDNSFSLIMSDENKNKNSLDLLENQFQLNSNLKNSEIDKECSPAPAPLRSSQSQIQNDLSVSHNLECPEVVQQSENKTDNIDSVIKIFDEREKYEFDELIEKPFDQSLYFLTTQQILENSSNNIDSNNNFELGDKSAAINAIPNNDSMSSLLNKVNNLDINNNNSNNNNYPAPKNNFEQIQIPTPLCSKNCTIDKKNKKGNILFLNTKKERKNTKNIIYRKLKPDSLRKKIKSRFHKKLKQIINTKLKEAGSKYYLDSLPQSFITNINIGFNKPLLNMTIRELFKKSFGVKAKDREKNEFNKRIMKYIEETPEINNNIDISDFFDSKYSEIIRKYMGGKYLMEDIERLKQEGEKDDYINRYSYIALHWIEFYENENK
jgi:hypothetical protein